MFAIEVVLLTGRYVATAFDDRSRAEWPPHPARVFSALAAAYFESGELSTQERDSLEWIEDLGPPQIAASEASERETVTVFVPVNDTSVVGTLDDEDEAVRTALQAVEHARGEGPKRLSSEEKKLEKARARFAEAVRKATAAVTPGKESREDLEKAAAVLPEHRGRQPRTFPAVSAFDPRVVFFWPDAQPSGERMASIDALLSRVVRLGHSSSLVSLRACAESPTATWVPDSTGELRATDDERILRVVAPGQMAALDAMPREMADEPGRVMPAAFQRYVRPNRSHGEPTPTTAFGQDWIVLRRTAGPRLPSVRAVQVARTVRRALLKGYGEGAPEILSGHRSPGEPSLRPHIAIAPLPFVAHPRADGSILGVALVLPSDATADERRAVHQAIARWSRSGAGSSDFRLEVHLGATGVLVLGPPESGVSLSTLLAATWCAPSTRWATATPIALDRNPGDLRSRDPAKEAMAYAAAEETIARCCERIGLPRPARVTAQVAAPLAGGDKVRHFPPFEAGTPAIQRVLVHATLAFDRPVEGPILLGAGRYLGLGLLRPVVDHG